MITTFIYTDSDGKDYIGIFESVDSKKVMFGFDLPDGMPWSHYTPSVFKKQDATEEQTQHLFDVAYTVPVSYTDQRHLSWEFLMDDLKDKNLYDLYLPYIRNAKTIENYPYTNSISCLGLTVRNGLIKPI
jgi:hypothetical protein